MKKKENFEFSEETENEDFTYNYVHEFSLISNEEFKSNCLLVENIIKKVRRKLVKRYSLGIVVTTI